MVCAQAAYKHCITVLRRYEESLEIDKTTKYGAYVNSAK
jgi:hypothetical protein